MAAGARLMSWCNMPCRSLGIGELIAPLTPNELSTLWLTRTLKHVRGRSDDRLTTLLAWDTLLQQIKNGIIPVGKFTVTYGRRKVAHFFYSDSGTLNPGRFTHLFEQGASLIARELEKYVPAIEDACRDARTQGVDVDGAGFIVTTGRGGALNLHYDPRDLVILQVEGSKRWRIYGPPVAEPRLPMAGVPRPQSAPLFDEFLKPGDVLFLPAGYWHKCENGPDRSLHLVLFVNLPTSDKCLPIRQHERVADQSPSAKA